MSYDTILAKTQSIIYKPGGVAAGLVVTSWAAVQAFISFREGTVIVYVDDSAVSPAPALVPGASGITDCEGRVEIRPFDIDSLDYTVLQVEDGATLKNLYAISDVEIRCNSQSATRSLSFSGTPNGGTLIMEEFGLLSQAATATQPGITAAPGTRLLVSITEQGGIVKEGFNDFTVPLFDVPATASLTVLLLNASFALNNFAAGAGDVTLGFDNSSAAFFFPTATPPTLPGITGTYAPEDVSIFMGDVTGAALTAKVVAWQNKLLDPATFVAPVLNAIPVFDGTQWVATATGPGVIIKVPFTFTSGTVVLQAAVAGAIVSDAVVRIDTPFDDVVATITMGTVGIPNLVFAPGDVTPSVSNQYANQAIEEILAPDTLQFVITPGASTQGTGTLFYRFQE